MDFSRKKLGRIGEDVATNYLLKSGYKILARNYVRKPKFGPIQGELDIVAKKGGVISFIEVKTATTVSGNQKIIENFAPEAKVNQAKTAKLIKTAEAYLVEKNLPLNSRWQIDVIGVLLDFNSRKAKLRHFKNAVAQ